VFSDTLISTDKGDVGCAQTRPHQSHEAIRSQDPAQTPRTHEVVQKSGQFDRQKRADIAHGLLHQNSVEQFADPPLLAPHPFHVVFGRRTWGRVATDAPQRHIADASNKFGQR
jgi:hypothetical protein